MNISKFILFEAALVISTIPILFFLKARNKKSPLFRSSNKEKVSDKTSINLPNKKKLLDLEKLARNEGSGIQLDSLVGDWKFVSVFNKDTDDEDSVFSSLLRVFSANLALKKDISAKPPFEFIISASIKFGLFSINFSGSSYLKGKQPFLPFFFKLIEFKSGSNVLYSTSIKESVEKEKSFFALIAYSESDGWLSARGQGGSLVLWLKD
tara:strand:- start:332 stop:958 length:627 start_codon:yes stop_codon:yes gene_type:complete